MPEGANHDGDNNKDYYHLLSSRREVLSAYLLSAFTKRFTNIVLLNSHNSPMSRYYRLTEEELMFREGTRLFQGHMVR